MKEFLDNPFIGIDEALRRANEDRRKIVFDNLPRYNLRYLDDVLFAIAPSELVVVGADTGRGKSTLANHIVFENCKRGRKVYFFSLEGHRNEVINRWKWQIICREYYKQPRGLQMSYPLFEMNKIEGIETEDEIATEEIRSGIKNLELFDRSITLDVNTLTKTMSAITDADLVVIDHLHYLHMVDEKSEAGNISEIMRAVKDLTESNKCTPVVLVSHLRKSQDRKSLPDNDDFMGSSNIPKIATTCIILSSDAKNHDLVNNKFSTIIRVTKSRSGASTTLAAQTFFDSRSNCYEQEYSLGKVLDGKFTLLESFELPNWARAKPEPRKHYQDVEAVFFKEA